MRKIKKTLQYQSFDEPKDQHQLIDILEKISKNDDKKKLYFYRVGSDDYISNASIFATRLLNSYKLHMFEKILMES